MTSETQNLKQIINEQRIKAIRRKAFKFIFFVQTGKIYVKVFVSKHGQTDISYICVK